MNHQYPHKFAVAAALALAAPLLAQTTLPGGVITAPLPTPMPAQQTFTTGTVGFTTNQTARLNVFNLNAVAATTGATTGATTATTTGTTTQPANCTVELAFYEPQTAATSGSTAVPQSGTLLSSLFVPDFAPGASVSFDLPRSSVTSQTPARAEIRGVVVVNPSSVPASISSTATNGYCTVFTTLEIFDASGSTVAFTSDTRPVGMSFFVPVAVGQVR
jgi:hypothetical protein